MNFIFVSNDGVSVERLCYKNETKFERFVFFFGIRTLFHWQFFSGANFTNDLFSKKSGMLWK